jgi:hypothetical protein
MNQKIPVRKNLALSTCLFLIALMMLVGNSQGASTQADHCYAVIISGGIDANYNDFHFYNDVYFLYRTLVNDYGYQDDHIYVLMSDGTDPGLDMCLQDLSKINSNPDLDGDGDNDVGYSATKANIATVFNILQNTLVTGDSLFIFTTDHGEPENTPQVGTNVMMNLWHENITDDQFAAEVDKIDPTVPIMIAMMECYSGGFIDDLIPGHPGQQRVIATIADSYSRGYAGGFSIDWISAVAGHDWSGNPVDADANNDGVVSWREAFNFADASDTQWEHPQFGESPSGSGDILALCPCYVQVPPVAMCQDVTISADENCQENANIDDGSYDPNGDSITFDQSPPGPYPLGKTTVTLTVTDSGGLASSCTAMVTVADTTPPAISASATPDILWPPNHKYREVVTYKEVSDNCDTNPAVTFSVTSNEPDDVIGMGDGNTANDIVIVDSFHFKLRAERQEVSTGRIYKITYIATDSSANSVSGSTTVIVPVNWPVS